MLQNNSEKRVAGPIIYFERERNAVIKLIL